MTRHPAVAVLAAAGAGRRFGGRKLLAPLSDGTPLGLAALRTLRAVLPRVVAVVPPDDPHLVAVLATGGAEVVVNPDPSRGLGASLALGVAASRDARGWLLALGDMPFIRPATVAAVVAALDAGAVMAAPVCGGRRGHPVGFAAALGAALEALTGDAGARELLHRHPAWLTPIPVADPGVHWDVDHVEDLDIGQRS